MPRFCLHRAFFEVPYIKPKTWWRDGNGRVVILTTERIPPRIIEQLHWNRGKKDETDWSFAIRRWDHDHLFQIDRLPMRLDNRANKSNVQELALALLDPDQGGFDRVISDISKNEKVISHRSVRGRNDLQEWNIATIMMYLGPVQYAELNVIAQLYGIDDAISLHYRDQLNQALGRNRGIRRSLTDAGRHQLVILPRLYRELGGRKFFRSGRYQFYLEKE